MSEGYNNFHRSGSPSRNRGNGRDDNTPSPHLIHVKLNVLPESCTAEDVPAVLTHYLRKYRTNLTAAENPYNLDEEMEEPDLATRPRQKKRLRMEPSPEEQHKYLDLIVTTLPTRARKIRPRSKKLFHKIKTFGRSKQWDKIESEEFPNADPKQTLVHSTRNVVPDKIELILPDWKLREVPAKLFTYAGRIDDPDEDEVGYIANKKMNIKTCSEDNNEL
ncbi:hypothetical protein RUND412_006060 [Rhizina undulata]